MTQRSLISIVCFGAAGAWPSLITTLQNALMSPLQLATREAICGSPLHAGPAPRAGSDQQSLSQLA